MDRIISNDTFFPSEPIITRILCCQCGVSIEPNPVNMCASCVRSRVDITADLPKTATLYKCKFCDRYLQPPNSWLLATLESKQLLAICLRKLKTSLTKIDLIDAVFVWTEPHSKRLKVKLTVQKTVMTGALLQQTFIVEFVVHNQMCDDCRRAEAKDFWRACVQVRQECDFKKTMFYLEQLVLKQGVHGGTSGVKPVPTGIDFFYPKLQDARRLVDFISGVLPCRHRYAQELVTHDTKNNIYDYKHTFCIELVPICKDQLARELGNMSQLVVCHRVSQHVSLIDPNTAQVADVSGALYWRRPFQAICQSKQLAEFFVIDVEPIDKLDRTSGHGAVSDRHRLADVWVVRSCHVGVSDVDSVCSRSHLGHLLHPGDLVLGFDLRNCNVNNEILDDIRTDRRPDVILVKKVYDHVKRRRRRNWKLKRLVQDDGNILPESASLQDDYEGFLEDLEEDEQMRQRVDIYKMDEEQKRGESGQEGENDDIAHCRPSFEEMLDDLHIDPVQNEAND